MRELKFRAWDEETEGFFYWDIRQPERTIYIEPEFSDDIQQYTGLTDKNGKEIYEGDIVEQFSGSEYVSTMPVLWRDDHCGFWLYYKGNPHLDLNEYRDKLEVIGNIYENPELLEVRNESAS